MTFYIEMAHWLDCCTDCKTSNTFKAQTLDVWPNNNPTFFIYGIDITPCLGLKIAGIDPNDNDWRLVKTMRNFLSI